MSDKGALFESMTRGERLRWLLEVREISQSELGRRIGLTQSAISNLVTDNSRKPSAPSLLLIAAELQCNPQWVLDGKGDPFAWRVITDADRLDLLTAYDGLSTEAKATVRATIRLLAKK